MAAQLKVNPQFVKKNELDIYLLECCALTKLQLNLALI